jgi:RNA polymerase subunit RPABC4/transcription elongation factor Spt4
MSDWICPNCGAEVDEGWNVCWQCGTSVDGAVNVSFVAEVDETALPDGWMQRIRCGGCGYEGKALLRHRDFPWWTLPVSIVLALTLVGMIPWAVMFIVLVNLETRVCPRCHRRDELRDWNGVPGAHSEKIWNKARAAEKRQAFKDRLVLLVFTGAALILSVGYVSLSIYQFARSNH